MATGAELRQYRDYLVAYGGGYLRNTLWASGSTCRHCCGIPGNPDFDTCYPCSHYYEPSGETSDRRGFVSYGWDNSQSSRVMYGYKEQVPSHQAYRVVNVMLFYALHEHLRCAADPCHGPAAVWATVPSLRGRAYPQALHVMTAGLLRNMPEALLGPAGDIQAPRSLRPDNFVVHSQVRGQHVLLLDDTWTSGGHAESAAAALKRAGAARVTLLVLARWLDLTRGRTEEFVRTELTNDFDPDRCPFGISCP